MRQADRHRPINKLVSLVGAVVALGALAPLFAGLSPGWTAVGRLVLLLDLSVLFRWGYWRNRS